ISALSDDDVSHATTSAVTGTASIVFLSFQLQGKTDGLARRAAQSEFVDRLYAVAQATKGEVHSFVANVAFVTFGAATMANRSRREGASGDHSESRRSLRAKEDARLLKGHAEAACRFVCRMRKEVERRGMSAVAGAVGSGPASCYVAGTRTRALVVEADWE